MSGNSPVVVSAQLAPHARLVEIVHRHRDHAWRAPLHAASQAQFERWRAQHDGACPLVVDLGCGHGDSALVLAGMHASARVLGVDQSAHRLARLAPAGFAVHGRSTLLRAEAATILRLLAVSGIGIDTLYLLYPNPWPKPEHLMRRWHGHPVFPLLLGTARRIVLRTNWPLYAEEFALAAQALGRSAGMTQLAAVDPVLTPFERKYVASGHARVELVIADA